MKKFSNHYSTMKRKRGLSGARGGGGTEEKPIKLFENITGRDLFEQANKDEINEVATERRMLDKSGNHAGHYQTALKEMWENLDQAAQEGFNNQAKDRSGDIRRLVPFIFFSHLTDQN
jgi:hypothetical protein